jgi:hypothetical protein
VKRVSPRTHLARTVLAVLMLALPSRAALSQAGTTPFAPEEKVYGLSLAEWAAAWTQWHFSIPKGQNPTLDIGGLYAGVGQRMPVWFLPSIAQPKDLTRTIVIPADYALLLPTPAEIAYNSPGKTTEEALRDFLRGRAEEWIGKVSVLEVSVDGVLTDARQYRVQSPHMYSLVLPPNNVLGVPVTAGQDQRCVAMTDGFFLIFPPLPVGKHVVAVHGIHPSPVDHAQTVDLHVIYNLIVQSPNEPIQ